MTTLVAQFDNSAAIQFFDAIRENPLMEDMTLEAGEVKHITTLAVQTLLALENSLRQHGHKLVVEHPSQDFTETFVDMGLADVLKRWSKE
jgi:anti-anti-sigma regulatory factor